MARSTQGVSWRWGLPLAGAAAIATAGCGGERVAFARTVDEFDPAVATRPEMRLVGEMIDFGGPESVRYDPEQDVFFVSNVAGFASVKDNNGYIVRVDAATLRNAAVFVRAGGVVTLHAPKGMTIRGDTLWVTDIDALRAFDRHTGAALATVDLRPQGAVFLNDITVGPDGALYVTDTGVIMDSLGTRHPGPDRIFVVGPGRAVSVFAQGDALKRPNGIVWDAPRNRFLVAAFDPFESFVFAMRPGDTTRTVVTRGKGKFDGLEVLADGRVLVTSWADSSVHLVGGGRDERIIMHLPEPADIGIDTRRNRLAVPQLMRNQVTLWTLPK